MHLIFSLAVPGSLYRFGRATTRLVPHLYTTSVIAAKQSRCPSSTLHYSGRTRAPYLPPTLPSGVHSCSIIRHEIPYRHKRRYTAQSSGENTLSESLIDMDTAALREVEDWYSEQLTDERVWASDGQFRKQLTRNARKAQRQSRPAAVLDSLGDLGRELYTFTPPGKKDLSYTHSRGAAAGPPSRNTIIAASPQEDTAAVFAGPVTLYSIFTRYFEHHRKMQSTEFEHTQSELEFLETRGITQATILVWASSLTERRSKTAAAIFEPGRDAPPLFLLMLYLRRKNIRASALSVVMKHIDRRIQMEDIKWETLKLMIIRLLRHTRQVWPESIPWIASLFTTEVTRLHNVEAGAQSRLSKFHADVTQFCNNLLLLLSLPASRNPVLFASHQEKAQFHVLHYMANTSPAIAVTRLGFRSVTRNQLAHTKTAQEREWAELKGQSWPPWKEDRTAMDEDKSYEFGASRASKILHRMYEAGYGGRIWEDVAQVYAGWDVDGSPTIQNRTSLPRFSSQFADEKVLRSMLWAARIRTTRTRREAWAGFLSCETSGQAAYQEIYLAMFEKLYYATAERSVHHDFNAEADEDTDRETHLLPGDMKEVLPDPISPLHYVFISEPVPTYREFVLRMQNICLMPSNRLLAFLLETCPDFEMGFDILNSARTACNGAIGELVTGVHDRADTVAVMPGYLFTAFIRFLCRFGRFIQTPPARSTFRPAEQHAYSFENDRQYLLEYAHTLLGHYRPRYRPAWTAFLDKMVQHKSSRLAGNIVRYQIICENVDIMENIDLDIDDETFRLTCTATVYAAQSASQDTVHSEDARHFFCKASSRLRTLFNNLVTVHVEQASSFGQQTETIIPPHIPGPAELHAYVRALGILRDYEGLYSFSTWLAKHHAEVTARAAARHSGSKLLFRTLVALRAAVDGPAQQQGAPEDIAQLIRAQIESVEEWGGWPKQDFVEMYRKGHLKTPMPSVGGR